MTKFICIVLFLFQIVVGQTNLYVSSNGSIGNDGLSPSTAFPTLQNARDYVRTINTNMNNDIIIYIMPGEYKFNKTLEFSYLDSGTNNHFIIYQAYDTNNKPIFSGGKEIIGWEIYDSVKNIWKANIENLYSRQVYRNGNKSIRSKSSSNYNLIEKTDGYFTFCNTSDDFFNWDLNIIQQRDLEVVSNNQWKSNRVPIQSKCNSQLNVNDQIWARNLEAQFRCGNKSSWLENCYELIDTADEWYIDRSNTNPINGSVSNILYYKTESSQAPTNIIIPQIETLIQGEGVNNLVFNNLIFKYTNWNTPSEYSPALNSNNGLMINQVDWYHIDGGSTYAGLISSSVKFTSSNNIKFLNNNFENLGGIAIQFIYSCNNNVICNNNFNNICASGISIGHPEQLGGENNLISNNLIENIATEYQGGVGIAVYMAKKTKIKNNTLQNFPYSGISIGYQWSQLPNNLERNEITGNKIDCSNQNMEMDDTGAIYTLGNQGYENNRTLISGNYILNYNKNYGAIYLDAGSSNFEITNNLIDTNISLTSSRKWLVITDCNANNIKFTNNYYNQQYITQSLPIPFLSNCSVGPTNSSSIVNSNNSSSTLNQNAIDIKNSAGIQLYANCQY